MDKIDCKTDCIGKCLNGLLFLHLSLQSVVNFHLFLRNQNAFQIVDPLLSMSLTIHLWRTYPYFKL